MRGTNVLEFLLLQHLDESGLNVKGKVSDFVQQNGPLTCKGQQTPLRLARSGNSAPLIAEELGFRQGGRQRGKIGNDKSLISPPTEGMDCLAGHYFARAVLTGIAHGIAISTD